MTVDPAIDLMIRAALALLFAVAATHKLRDMTTFRGTFADYRLLPDVAARAVPAGEAAVALLLVAPATSALGKAAAVALLVAYAAAIGVNLARGRRHIDCGCGGPHARRPIGPGLVVRNTLLAGVALAALAPVYERPLVWVDGLTISGAVLALAALYVAADRLMAYGPALARLREAA